MKIGARNQLKYFFYLQDHAVSLESQTSQNSTCNTILNHAGSKFRCGKMVEEILLWACKDVEINIKDSADISGCYTTEAKDGPKSEI